MRKIITIQRTLIITLIIISNALFAQRINNLSGKQEIKRIDLHDNEINNFYADFESKSKYKEILLSEDFSNGVPPENWTVAGSGTSNWQSSNTSYAGGEAPEVKLNYSPPFNGTTRLVSPVINTNTYSTLVLEFKHLYRIK